MYKRKCKWCGEKFVTNRLRQKFCCSDCRISYGSTKNNYRTDSGQGQICWRCAKACGKCSWSSELKPVKGWKAMQVTVKNEVGDNYRTYKILFCPEYTQDKDLRVKGVRG